MRLHDIAFYFCASFILGIGLASLGVNIWFAILAYCALAVSNLYFKKDWKIFIIGLTLLLGFFYYNFYVVWQDQRIPFDRQLSFEAIVAGDPKRGLEYQELDIKLEDPWRGKVHAYTNLYPEYHYGDLLKLEGKIVKSPSGKVMVGFPKIELLAENQGNSFKAILFKIKNGLVENLKKVLPPDKSALASGILLGERAEFSEDLKDAMQKSGTTHIVALSGYNVAIISNILFGYLLYVFSRRASFYISVLLIIAFVLMTGAEPSVVRAAFMGVIILVAEQSSRAYSFRNAITITAFAMLVFNPTLLIFDVGFEFSFLALLGLIYIEPLIRKAIVSRLRDKDKWSERFKKGLWKSFFQTLSAQLAVAPIALYVFGYLSPFSLIANVLILQFIPFTMLLAFLTAVLGFVFSPFAIVASWALGILLGYEIFIINFFSFNWL